MAKGVSGFQLMLSRAECCNWKRLLAATPSICFKAKAFCLLRLAGYVLESCRRELRIFRNLVVINTNTAAIEARGNVTKVWDRLKKTMSRLSSGNKIVEPQDDAAGLAVSSRLDSKKYRNLFCGNKSKISYRQKKSKDL